MPKKSPRAGIISAEAYRDILLRNQLREKDGAWIAGVGERQSRAWAIDEYPVPRYAGLLLMAYDEGLITADWLSGKIDEPMPD